MLIFLRKYGEAASVDFVLHETDGVLFKTDAVYAAGDVKVSKDEGAEANPTSGFADEGRTYSQAFTVTEMQAARIMCSVEDQTSPAVFASTSFVIETYGHASAQHAFDLDIDTVTLADAGLTAAKIATDAIGSAELAASAATEIADAVLGRGVFNIEDTADTTSLAAVILAMLESSISGTTWTIRKTGGTTFVTKTVTTDSGADPITGVT